MTPSFSFNPLTAQARDLQRWLENGSLQSVDLVETYIKQIERYDGYLHSMISTIPMKLLLETAQSLDEERSAKTIRSPLHGIPVILKDNIATHPRFEVKTTAGSLALAESRVKRNAEIVDTLVVAGAIILGKANLSEMSNFKGNNIISGWSAVRGQTQSAYVRGGVDPSDGRDGHSNPSGSSSGSAVAVSAGFAPFSVATETDGSLIVPAARAALYGIKPTIGLVPQSGIVPISHTMDAAGPMAKSAYDVALLLDYLVAPETRENQESYTTALTESWEGLGVATLDPEGWSFAAKDLRPVEKATAQINREISAAYLKLKEVTKSYAHHIEIDLDLFTLDGEYSESVVLNADFAKDIDSYLEDLEVSPVRTLRELIEFNKKHAAVELPPEAPNQDRLIEAYAQNKSAEDYDRHLNNLRDAAKNQALDRIFSEYKVNVVIAPADSRITCLASGSGYPIVSLPLS